jgi:hypothetical protein
MWMFRPFSVATTYNSGNPDTYSYGTLDLRVAIADADNFIFVRLAWSGIPYANYLRWTWQLFERIGGTDFNMTVSVPAVAVPT